MSDKPILNTGLDVLLGGVEKTSKSTVRDIELNLITPNRFQPREFFDEERLHELAESIKNTEYFLLLLLENPPLISLR